MVNVAKALDRAEGNFSFTFTPETPEHWAGRWAKIVAHNKKNGNRSAPIYVQITREGAGTPGNPYIIRTPAQLDDVRSNLSAHYKLANNIDLTSYLTSGGAGYAKWNTEGWLPIGVSAIYGGNSFTGSLNGADYKITGLWINRSWGGGYNVGLFHDISGSVQNLGVEVAVGGIVFTGSKVGGVAGSVSGNGSIINCYVTGNVRGFGSVGGITGDISGNGNITNCYTTGTVSSTSTGAGGVVGVVSGNGSITNCYATGVISGDCVGGIAGYVYGGIITNCVALNSSVMAAVYVFSTSVGRVVGDYRAGTLNNNFARSNMVVTMNGVNKTLDKGGDKADGADCAATPTQSWWTTAAPNGVDWRFGSNDANPWKWSSALSRPILYWQ